jgi:putative hydrolase of HD superfamily
MPTSHLQKQIDFIIEIDKLKNILRQTVLMDASRHENSAEHSWHLAMMAVLLYEYAKEEVEILKVIKMLLIHDIVEIDAGDTFCYDEEGNKDKAEREKKAADRIFNLLPDNQATEIRTLWDEFEGRKTAEAKFANALDRFQPLLHNCQTMGLAWKKHRVKYNQVLEKNKTIADGAPLLWECIEGYLNKAVEKGHLDR